MRKQRLRSVFVCSALTITTAAAVAKRLPPKPVAPIVADGVRYSAESDRWNQFVVATDVSTAKQLWKVKVFHTHINLMLEEDAQEVFITNLRLAGKSLFVQDEKARCYSVDLKTHRVSRALCGTTFSQDPSARL